MFWRGRREEALDVISKVRGLELRAREVAEGVLIGIHRSRHRGTSIEFAEHKSYSPGDEIRLIDWRLFARTDRFFIKQFEDETRICAYLIVDASGSMAYPEGGEITKFEYAQLIASALGFLLLRQGDEVGAGIISKDELGFLPARSGEKHFLALIELLAKAEPEGRVELGEIIFQLSSRLKRRSLVIILSDFLDPGFKIEKSLKLIRSRGAELILFQVLDRGELTFPFSQLVWFEGFEEEGRLLLDAQKIRREYLKRLKQWQNSLKRTCQELGVDFQVFPTDTSASQALSEYLLQRSRIRWRRG